MKRSRLLLTVSMYFVVAIAAVFLPSFDVSINNGVSIKIPAAHAADAKKMCEDSDKKTLCEILVNEASTQLDDCKGNALEKAGCQSALITSLQSKCQSSSSDTAKYRTCIRSEAASASPTTGSGGDDEGCGTAFDWIVCKIIRGVADTVEFVEDRFIQPFLDFKPLSTSVDSNPMYKVWQVMRNLANALFIIIFLVFIFANTLSINLDAYTVKKMLPKLVAAAILVQLSYLLASLAIDITNIFGRGLFILGNDIIPPYSSPDGSGEVRGGLLGLTGLAVGAANLAFGAVTGSIFVVMIGAFFGIMAVFLTLMFRQILITVLIIAAPIAFALWVLPNTENLFRKWLDMFIKVLAMYPL
ncbi:MAG TPA: hypothetical protein VNA68_00210, partial [Candidatus Dormibacteraeota bacterium]|nr:hypothetical protein [Candidatus Dormibacteraeota bacterium]